MTKDLAKANFATACMTDVAGRFEDIGKPLSFAEKADLFNQFYDMVKGGLPAEIHDRILNLWTKAKIS